MSHYLMVHYQASVSLQRFCLMQKLIRAACSRILPGCEMQKQMQMQEMRFSGRQIENCHSFLLCAYD